MAVRLIHDAMVVEIVEGAIGAHGIHFDGGHAVDSFSEIVGLLNVIHTLRMR